MEKNYHLDTDYCVAWINMKTIEREVRREINFFSHTFSNIDKKNSMMNWEYFVVGEVDVAHFDKFFLNTFEEIIKF